MVVGGWVGGGAGWGIGGEKVQKHELFMQRSPAPRTAAHTPAHPAHLGRGQVARRLAHVLVVLQAWGGVRGGVRKGVRVPGCWWEREQSDGTDLPHSLSHTHTTPALPHHPFPLRCPFPLLGHPPLMDSGPNSSSGTEKRVSRRSK